MAVYYLTVSCSWHSLLISTVTLSWRQSPGIFRSLLTLLCNVFHHPLIIFAVQHAHEHHCFCLAEAKLPLDKDHQKLLGGYQVGEACSQNEDVGLILVSAQLVSGMTLWGTNLKLAELSFSLFVSVDGSKSVLMKLLELQRIIAESSKLFLIFARIDQDQNSFTMEMSHIVISHSCVFGNRNISFQWTKESCHLVTAYGNSGDRKRIEQYHFLIWRPETFCSCFYYLKSTKFDLYS